MQNDLVQVPDLLGKARLAIAALLRGPKLVLEQRVILGADNGKIVAHCVAVFICRSRGSDLGWKVVSVLMEAR